MQVIGCDSLQEGDTCTLECRVTGGNPGQVSPCSWRFRQKFSGSGFIDRHLTNLSYILRSVSPEDAGDYKCVVEHEAGDVTANKTVHVECKSQSMV